MGHTSLQRKSPFPANLSSKKKEKNKRQVRTTLRANTNTQLMLFCLQIRQIWLRGARQRLCLLLRLGLLASKQDHVMNSHHGVEEM